VEDAEVVAVAGGDIDVTQSRNVILAMNRETGLLALLNIACLLNRKSLGVRCCAAFAQLFIQKKSICHREHACAPKRFSAQARRTQRVFC